MSNRPLDAIDCCVAIEPQAYAAAIVDVQLRAEAIGVSLITPPAMAELPFLGRFLSPCNEDTDVIGALFWSPESSYFNPEAPATAEIFREVLVTYTIKNQSSPGTEGTPAGQHRHFPETVIKALKRDNILIH